MSLEITYPPNTLVNQTIITLQDFETNEMIELRYSHATDAVFVSCRDVDDDNTCFLIDVEVLREFLKDVQEMIA